MLAHMNIVKSPLLKIRIIVSPSLCSKSCFFVRECDGMGLVCLLFLPQVNFK
jgi:hypothetical protein